MINWRQVLRDHDPIEPLTADEASAIRHRVIAEAVRAQVSSTPLRRLAPVWALGGVLTMAAVAGILVARTHPPAPPQIPAAPSATGDMRQLQFSTPGGTRIIWQFNPNFSLRETLP
jgi:hypothetical protein